MLFWTSPWLSHSGVGPKFYSWLFGYSEERMSLRSKEVEKLMPY